MRRLEPWRWTGTLILVWDAIQTPALSQTFTSTREQDMDNISCLNAQYFRLFSVAFSIVQALLLLVYHLGLQHIKSMQVLSAQTLHPPCYPYSGQWRSFCVQMTIWWETNSVHLCRNTPLMCKFGFCIQVSCFYHQLFSDIWQGLLCMP